MNGSRCEGGKTKHACVCVDKRLLFLNLRTRTHTPSVSKPRTISSSLFPVRPASCFIYDNVRVLDAEQAADIMGGGARWDMRAGLRGKIFPESVGAGARHDEHLCQDELVCRAEGEE